jgi:hypothetical protein
LKPWPEQIESPWAVTQLGEVHDGEDDGMAAEHQITAENFGLAWGLKITQNIFLF